MPPNHPSSSWSACCRLRKHLNKALSFTKKFCWEKQKKFARISSKTSLWVSFEPPISSTAGKIDWMFSHSTFFLIWHLKDIPFVSKNFSLTTWLFHKLSLVAISQHHQQKCSGGRLMIGAIEKYLHPIMLCLPSHLRSIMSKCGNKKK